MTWLWGVWAMVPVWAASYGPDIPLKGVALGAYVDTGSEEVRTSLQEIAELGANAILIKVVEVQETWQSTQIMPDPHLTLSTRQVESTIQLAKAQNFVVALMPVVLLRLPRTSTDWRGMIEPTNVEAWFRSYEGFLRKYHRMAQRLNVDWFCVGSELVSMERHSSHWVRLIDEMRKGYEGKLFYSANWDHLGGSIAWQHLDALGVNAYYELAQKGSTPTLDELKVQWTSHQKEILAWARRFKKPVIFTEVGYPSRVDGLYDPWNHIRLGRPDSGVQKLGYQAFLEVWGDVREVFGAFIYEWRGVGGENDGGYTPRGKPALKILRKWMRTR